MVGVKKERVWNDPPGVEPEPVSLAKVEITPEVHMFFRNMMMHADVNKTIYGLSIAFSYLSIYFVIVTFSPETTQQEILWMFGLFTIAHLFINMFYLYTKYRR
jgi:hypothetical protein